MLQTTVKKWFRDKNSGFLDNGNAPDIMVTKSDLVNCDYLKVGVTSNIWGQRTPQEYFLTLLANNAHGTIVSNTSPFN
jgi:hypothetical protein